MNTFISKAGILPKRAGLWTSREEQARDFANTLYWATKNHVPLHEALGQMRESDARLLVRIAIMVLLCASVLLLPLVVYQVIVGAGMTDRFYSRLGKVVKGLEKGELLSDLLSKHMRRLLPRHFIPMIKLGEETDSLCEVAGMLRKMDIDPFGHGRAIRSFFHVLWLTAPLMLALGLFSRAFFRFRILIQHSLPDVSKHSLLDSFSFRQTMALAGGIAFLVALSLVVTFILYIVTGYGRWSVRFVGSVVPFFREWVAKTTRIRLYALMAMQLRLGRDIGEAFTCTADHCKSWWYGPKLRQLENHLYYGHDWRLAWQKVGIGTSTEQWLITNTPRNENPATGFGEAAEILRIERDQYREVYMLALRLALLGVTGLVVILSAHYCFGGLIMIVEGSM